MSFQFEKLTTKAQEAVANAQQMATAAGNPEITVLHLLNALLSDSDGIVKSLLEIKYFLFEDYYSCIALEKSISHKSSKKLYFG